MNNLNFYIMKFIIYYEVFLIYTYHETSLTKLLLSWIPAFASKIDEWSSPMKSEDTTSSSVYSRMPLRGPAAASLILFLISS